MEIDGVITSGENECTNYMDNVRSAGEEIYQSVYQVYVKERNDAENELFVTETIMLRLLSIAREEFLRPLKVLLTSNEYVFDYVDEFIQFRTEMFQALHPKGKT